MLKSAKPRESGPWLLATRELRSDPNDMGLLPPVGASLCYVAVFGRQGMGQLLR